MAVGASRLAGGESARQDPRRVAAAGRPPEVRSPHEPVKVLVADDHTLFRTMLTRMLGTDSRVLVVGEARDGVEAIAATHELKPNVVLMELDMPRMGGVEATRRLAEEAPEVRVLVISAYSDAYLVTAAMDSGAAGFVDKDVSFDEILTRILAVGPSGASARRSR